MPGPRSWHANLRARPRFMVHLKHGSRPARDREAGREPTWRRVITAVLDLQNRPEIAARVSRRRRREVW